MFYIDIRSLIHVPMHCIMQSPPIMTPMCNDAEMTINRPIKAVTCGRFVAIILVANDRCDVAARSRKSFIINAQVGH